MSDNIRSINITSNDMSKKENETMAKIFALVFAVMYVATLVGCASTPAPAPAAPAPPPMAQIPAWVDEPYIDGGLAASECVKNYPGQRSLLMSKAKTLGRASLGAQIETNVKSLTKTFGEMTETAGEVSVGEDFERVTKEVMDQQLMGVRMSQSGYFELEPSIQYLCVMMVLDPAHTRAFYDALMDKTGASTGLSNKDDKVLYMEFKASQAQAELDHATGN